ncbi:MAG: anti-sigma factor domain-containing protein [Phycisphaerae bacterium]
MTCQERRDLMLLYAAGALEGAEAGEVREHLLGGCPACAGALAEAEAVVHAIPQGLKPVEAPAGAWEKIEGRIAVKERVEPRRVEGTTRKVFVPWFVAAAAMVGVVAMGTSWFAQRHDIEQMRTELASASKRLEADQTALKAAGEALAEARARFADLERRVQKLGDENKAMLVSLEQAQTNYVAKIERLMHADQYAIAPAQDKGARGTLFWNKGDGTWTVMASHLKPLPAGRCYEMWIVTASGEKLAAGTFDATPSGTAMYEMKLPADVGAIQLAAVTDEPAGGVAKATGQIQFLSDVTKKQ